MGKKIGSRAAVIGASIGGLAVAQVLADRFEQVCVIDRDRLPDRPAQRESIPQGRHVHVLLAGGEQALSELFPGFRDELEAAGAVSYRAGQDIRIERPGFDPFPQRDLGFAAYALSRPLVEHLVRERVRARPEVEWLAHARVLGLQVRPDGSAVTGVKYSDAAGREQALEADLVVDASGRAVPTCEMLQATGRPLPPQSEIGVDMRYASGMFEMPDDAPEDWKGLLHYPKAPESSLGAFLFPLEGRRWLISTAARGVDPAHDWDSFMNVLERLRVPTASRAVRHARRIGEVVRHGFTASVRRHFAKAASLPDRLLLVGDAVCRFNPIYGQGMSVAAQEACLLKRHLDAVDDAVALDASFARAYFEALDPIIDAPWCMAAIPDFVFPQTRGERPPDLARQLATAMATARLAARDAAIHKLQVEVQHLLKPRSAFREPEVARKIEEELAAMAAAMPA